MSGSYAKTIALDILSQMAAAVTLTGVTTPASAGDYAANGDTFNGHPVSFNATTGLYVSAGIIGAETNWLITDRGPSGGIPTYAWTGPAIAAGPAGAYAGSGGEGDTTLTQPWAVAYNGEFERMYVTNLESFPPAGDPSSQMTLTIAPVAVEIERTGWGGARITVSLGLLFNVLVAVSDGSVTDANIDAYEQFVDQVCTWLVGPRKFAGNIWSAGTPEPVFGDNYNDHLYGENGEFHVPVLLDVFCDVGVK